MKERKEGKEIKKRTREEEKGKWRGSVQHLLSEPKRSVRMRRFRGWQIATATDTENQRRVACAIWSRTMQKQEISARREEDRAGKDTVSVLSSA